MIIHSHNAIFNRAGSILVEIDDFDTIFQNRNREKIDMWKTEKNRNRT